MRRSFAAQGATEYLVLLAVVLIIALVSIALLGFFPGTANESQVAESQIYWKSAAPIAIVDAGSAYYVRNWGPPYPTVAYIRIRNTGTYPVTLTKMLGGGSELLYYHDTVQYHNMTDITLAPGEETCFGHWYVPGSVSCMAHSITLVPVGASGWSHSLSGAGALCNYDGTGVLTVKNFGFEYQVNVEGQRVTKREMGGSPFLIKCGGYVNG